MNLRQIEVFRAIMATGSVSDAGRLLHVSVPAVSRVLSHTETQLNFPLFMRIKGRLSPTAEARRLYHEVEDVYQGVQRISDLTHELSARRSGLISVVSSPGIGHMLVPMAIAHYHQANPETRVHFKCLNQDLLRERLLSRHFDLGISLEAVDHPNLITMPVARCRIVCICPRTHPLAARNAVGAQDLLPYDLMSYPRGTPFGELVRHFFASQENVPRTMLEVGSPQNACALTHLGAGIALVDEFSLQAWPDARFRILPVEGIEPLVAHLVHLRTDPLSPAAEAFARTLRSVLMQRGLAAPQVQED